MKTESEFTVTDLYPTLSNTGITYETFQQSGKQYLFYKEKNLEKYFSHQSYAVLRKNVSKQYCLAKKRRQHSSTTK